MNGQRAARKYDLTTHAGMILQGEPTVCIGHDTPEELLMLAIWRIRNSDYGRTEQGQKTIALLEEKLKDGTLRFGHLDPKYDGEFKNGIITVNDDRPAEDVDHLAKTLVHEGTHAQNNNLEIPAHEQENKFYEEQRTQGYWNQSNENLRNAIAGDNAEKDGLKRDEKNQLRKVLESRDYPSQTHGK